MSRNTKARGKIARRLGINVFGNPKYDRLLKRKPAGPGMPKRGRIRQTEYGRQLVEKQKIRYGYGVTERQLTNLFATAKRMKGNTGHNLLIMLERRLDNVVYRLGMASSRSQARQLVSHGHILLNGRKVTIPSAIVRSGDSISAKDRAGTKELLRRTLSENSGRPVPPWLALVADDLSANVTAEPTRDMIPTIAEEQLVVEYYSR